VTAADGSIWRRAGEDDSEGETMMTTITERYAAGERDFAGATLTAAALGGANLTGARRSSTDAPVAGYALVTVLESA